MTAVVPHQSYMTQHPSLFTLINHCVIAFSFALMFTIVVGLLSAVLPLCCYGKVLDFMIKKTLDSQKTLHYKIKLTHRKYPENALQCQP